MRMMRTAVISGALLALAACATDSAAPAVLGGPILTGSLIPLEGPPGRFATDLGEITLRIEPGEPGHAAWFIGGGAGPESRLDVERDEHHAVLRPGPGQTVEILRVGAQPGDAWESSGLRIRFEGWERLTTPAGIFDAARIRTETVVAQEALREIETWWFTPDVGVVRYDQSKGGVLDFSMRRIE